MSSRVHMRRSRRRRGGGVAGGVAGGVGAWGRRWCWGGDGSRDRIAIGAAIGRAVMPQAFQMPLPHATISALR